MDMQYLRNLGCQTKHWADFTTVRFYILYIVSDYIQSMIYRRIHRVSKLEAFIFALYADVFFVYFEPL